MMLAENAYAAIDLGETTAKLVIGTVYENKFALCGAFSAPSSGINNGEVSSRGEIQKTMIDLLEQAREMGFEFQDLILVLPSTNLTISRRMAKNLVGSGNNIVAARDIDILNKAVAQHNLTVGDMVVGIYPIAYYVDGVDAGKDPLGIRGNSIALDAFVLTSPQLLARPIVDAIQDMELGLLDVIPCPIALANAVTTESERRDGVSVVDIGGKQTSASLFYRGMFCAYQESYRGGAQITDDLMKRFKKDRRDAEALKKKYGAAVTANASDLGVYYNKATGETVKEKEIVGVVEDDVAAIGSDVKANVELLSKTASQGKIVVAGGVSNTINIKKKIGESLGREVAVRRLEVVGATDAVYYPAIGAIVNYLREQGRRVEVGLINY